MFEFQMFKLCLKYFEIKLEMIQILSCYILFAQVYSFIIIFFALETCAESMETLCQSFCISWFINWCRISIISIMTDWIWPSSKGIWLDSFIYRPDEPTIPFPCRNPPWFRRILFDYGQPLRSHVHDIWDSDPP